MRNGLGSTGSYEAAIGVIRRLLELVKPVTGWIQLVDGAMFAGKISEDDRPWLKLNKTVGNLMISVGLNSSAGSRVATLLKEAGGKDIANFETREASSVSRTRCTPGLEQIMYVQIEGLVETVNGALERMPNPPVSTEEFRRNGVDCLTEAREIGVSMSWFAA